MEATGLLPFSFSHTVKKERNSDTRGNRDCIPANKGFNCVCTHVVQLVVESASVAHGLAVLVSPPQRCSGGLAVGAHCALTLCGSLKKIHEIIRTLTLKKTF